MRDAIEEATSMTVTLCDNCNCVHFNLLDESGVVFATGVLHPDNIDKLIADLATKKRQLAGRKN